MTDTKAPEGGWQYTAKVRSKTTGATTDVTESLASLYDLVTSSMDWGSGFLSTEDMHRVVQVGLLCGFDIPTCNKSYVRRIDPADFLSGEFEHAECRRHAGHSDWHEGEGRRRGDPPVALGLIRWDVYGNRLPSPETVGPPG